MLEKIRKKISPEIIMVVLMITAFAIYYHINSWNTYIELPYLSWIDQFNNIGVKYFDGTLKIKDFFIPYSEHGMLANNLLFLFNIVFFNLTTKLDVVVNTILIIIIAVKINLLFVKNCKQVLPIKLLGLVIINFIMFEVLQLSSGAMETQVRMGLMSSVLWIFAVDKYFSTEDVSYKKIIHIAIWSLLTINFFGTLYSFALVPISLILLVYFSILNKKIDKRSLILVGIMVLCVLIYFIEYGLFFNQDSDLSGGLVVNFINLFVNFGNTFKGYLAYSGNVFIGYAAIVEGNVSETYLLLIGGLVFVLVIFSLVLFFMNKSKKELVSLMLILYSIFVIIIVMVGRPFEWRWFYSEWYIVHAKYQIIGSIIIIFSYTNINKWIKRAMTCLQMALILFVSIQLAYSEDIHIKRQFYVTKYYENIQQYLLVQDCDYMPVNENGETPLFGSLENTIKMNQYLKKYNLSIFNQSVITNDINTTLKSGYYAPEADGAIWLQQYSVAYLTSDVKSISMGLYLNQYSSDNSVTIRINGIVVDSFEITEGYYGVSYDVPETSEETITLEIIVAKKINITNGDSRALAILLTSINLETK